MPGRKDDHSNFKEVLDAASTRLDDQDEDRLLQTENVDQ